MPLVAGATALGAYFDSSGTLHASTAGATLLAPWGATEIRWPQYAATVLQSADFVAETHEDARDRAVAQAAPNAAVNPLTALLDRANGALLEQPSLLRIAEAAAREAARIGIRLGYVPADFDPAARLTALFEETRSNRSSMAEDLARGRRSEADAILGAILREGERVQETAPVVRALLALMHAAEGERGGPA